MQAITNRSSSPTSTTPAPAASPGTARAHPDTVLNTTRHHTSVAPSSSMAVHTAARPAPGRHTVYPPTPASAQAPERSLAADIGTEAVAVIARELAHDQRALVDECSRVVGNALLCCQSPAQDSADAISMLLGDSQTLPGMVPVLRDLQDRLARIAAHLPLSGQWMPDTAPDRRPHPVCRVLAGLLQHTGCTQATSHSLATEALPAQIEHLQAFAADHPAVAGRNIDSMITSMLVLSHHVAERSLAISQASHPLDLSTARHDGRDMHVHPLPGARSPSP